MSDQPSTPQNPNQERLRRLAARQKLLRERFPPRPRVRVVPRDEAARKALKHPHGAAFPADGGSVEWPLDRFTKRRLLDGSVKKADQPAAHRQQGRAHQPSGS